MACRAVTIAPTDLPQATWPVVRSLLVRASQDGKRKGGVLGVRSRPAWAGPSTQKVGELSVEVVPCMSALAVREALRQRGHDRWLVILTDRDESDLGLGITSHFYGGVLRNPDPWEAVRDQFGATRIDRRLVAGLQARDIANGILAARGDTPWPPARGGFLTLDHLCAAIAVRRLAFPDLSGSVAPEDVLAWAADSGRSMLLGDLRELAGEPVARVVIRWLAGICGKARPIVEQLLSAGRAEDIVPLGLAGRAVLNCQYGSEPWVLLRAVQLGLPDVTTDQLTALVQPLEHVVRTLIQRRDDPSARQTGRILARADTLVDELRATAGVESSELLRSSLTSRLASLGERLRQATAKSESRAKSVGVDGALVDPALIPAINQVFDSVRAHALADHRDELRIERAFAAVRLARWLASELGAVPGFADQMRRYRDIDSWVDRAYSDAWRGVDEESLAQGMRGVLAATKLRRAQHDVKFAAALATPDASAGDTDVLLIEDVLQKIVVPLANGPRPVLLVIADGMSASVSSEIVDDIERRYDSWSECVPTGAKRRSVVVAALPSLTVVSRCSLLTGALATGQMAAERAGFAAFMKAHGLTGALFHKLSLDTSGAGLALSQEVGLAMDDIEGKQVVACVLNTIDDALDRSDPGIDWTPDTVKHLRPLLERARRAGRTVVLTADHGHVVERREGRMISVGVTSSNRSRPAAGGPGAAGGEVRVTGSRVLMHDGDAVLAVDEAIRYGPLKAGYHGGGAPAEVVVPLHVLAPGEPPKGWALATPQAPLWWNTIGTTATSAPARVIPLFPASGHPSLFDELPPVEEDLVARVIGSAIFTEQRKRAARVPVKDEQVANLLRMLLAVPDNRIDPESAATALGVARVQLAGALPMVQRLLNVEQYPVLERDADGTTIVLNLALLKEQFGVGG